MSQNRDRLRIALQKSGRLSEPSTELLRRAGLVFRSSRDKLFLYGENMAVDVLLVRDDDIPELLIDGSAELGIVGSNVLGEQRLAFAGDSAAFPVVRSTLGFGQCRLAIALPQGETYVSAKDLAGKRIATSYPALLADWLARGDIAAEVVVLNGSVEIAPRLGKADAICDLVSTGATLAANQLHDVDTLLESQSVLAATTRPLSPVLAGLMASLCSRIESVLSGSGMRLLMLQAPRSAIPAITDMLPSQQAPCLTRLDDQPDAVSLQVLCNRSLDWQHLERLKQLGAYGLMVLTVEQVLA